MEKARKQYSLWKDAPLPENLKKEAIAIQGDAEEIYDRFCRDMTFGTSGLRGKMGIGTNRINEIVIKRATMGVADYLLSKHEKPKVVIGYDTRKKSAAYAEETARTLAARGIDSYVFMQPVPVPAVSFGIRYMGADGGIMITASHNPKEYNGYKVYDHYGNQIDDLKARTVESYINRHPYFDDKTCVSGAAPGSVAPCPDDVERAYIKAVMEQTVFWTEDETKIREAFSGLNVVYTPLNGTGTRFVRRVFANLGLTNVKTVAEQTCTDGEFSTCPAPNPENEKVFDLALTYADDDTDIIIATDPDSDRMGVMARKDGGFQRLTGDQAGILMLDYICWCHSHRIGNKNMRGQKMVYKSFVSSPYAEDIARAYRIHIKNVPTGFKNIAMEMELLKEAGREEDFLFGFEESLGYLYGNYTRDKDGVLASQMIATIAACLKAKGMTLFDRLAEMYRTYGYAGSKAVAIEFRSEKDREKIGQIMESLFSGNLTHLMGQPLTVDASHCCDDMFRALLPQGHQIIIRPSGTELKLKIYAFAKGSSRQQALENLDVLLEQVRSFAESV